MVFRSLFCVFVLSLGVALPHSAAKAQADEAVDDFSPFYQEVMVAIASQPRPNFAVEAEAVIAFSIVEDGTIDAISVAQSSGSDPLDAAALELVQNAAPFPAPPQGANRSFSIIIKSVRPQLGFGNLDNERP